MELMSSPGHSRLDRAVATLRALPYKHGAFAARNWGHPFHSLLSYPSKIKPSIAHFLVRLFTQDGQVVLDPFSGVGTIPFEACSQKRAGIGVDLSPIALHATLAKVDPPTLQEVKDILRRLAAHVNEHKDNVDISTAEEEIIPYYHERTLREILAVRDFLAGSRGSAASFVTACMLHILHGNRPYALSRRSHNIMPWPPRGEFVYKSAMDSLTAKCVRMLSSPLPSRFVRGQSFQSDARTVPLPDSSVAAIITSPPFFRNRDFLRMNRIRLWFCQWSYEYQEAMKSRFVEHAEDIGSYDGIFREFHRVLCPGGTCIMHLGVVGRFDMAKELAPIAQNNNFVLRGIVHEDTSTMESHGIVDRGATRAHQFLILEAG